ncbi:MAG: ribose-phosphate diphosphokinase [Nitrospirae bacterium]|nr:ribose-phosphate diphosphokinase [Nitrospirota bacterium]
MKWFLTPSTAHLRDPLIEHGVALGGYETARFADGERGYRLTEDVTGQAVTLLASVTPDPASLFDLLALFRLLGENGSQTPSVVIPYLGYARQDRPVRSGEGSLGVMVAELVRDLQPAEVRVLDVHSPRIVEALGPRAIELSALPLFAERLARGEPVDVVVAPDAGARRRAQSLAERFVPTAEVVIVEKTRPRPNVAVARTILGDVGGKRVVIVDDMIDTGGTICEAVRLVSEGGARSIRVAATHGIFSGDARPRILRLPVRETWVTNSLPQPLHERIRVLDITPILF